MRLAIALVFLTAGCHWDLTLGRGDGVQPFRFEEKVSNPARTGESQMLIVREVEIIRAESSAAYKRDLGTDKIGSLKGVTLTISEMRIEGVDLGVTGPPEVFLMEHQMIGVPGDSATLDDTQVGQVRASILAGLALTTTLAISLPTPKGTLDADLSSLHIVLVVQPTLVIDGTSFVF